MPIDEKPKDSGEVAFWDAAYCAALEARIALQEGNPHRKRGQRYGIPAYDSSAVEDAFIDANHALIQRRKLDR